MKTYDDGLHRLVPDDWELLREVRLRSLQESPSAFGSTYAGEKDRDEAGWRAWLENPFPKFVVTHGGSPVAVGGAYVDEDGRAHVIAMWTAPEARRQGRARQIVNAIIDWSRRAGHPLELRVTTTNLAARRTYVQCGFEPTGIIAPLREGSVEQVEILSYPSTSR